MGHLLEIIFGLLNFLIPGPDHRRSSMGESRMDKSARWSGYVVQALILLAIVGGIAWYSTR